MDERFADLLRRFRARSQLSQAELAERANLSARAVSDLERGVRSRPYLPTVRALSDALALNEEEGHLFAASVRRGRPSPDAFPVPDSRLNIPLPISSFVDRRSEMALLGDLLLSGKHRLVTITGGPGVGKTRLALETGRALSDEHSLHVSYVNLSEQTQPERLIVTVGQAFGVTAGQPADLPGAIATRLQDEPHLLILDNLEHLLQGVHQIRELLTSAPFLTVLATSRAPTLLQGEQQVALFPLGVPSVEDVMTSKVEALAAFPGVDLLVDRLKDKSPALQLDAGNARKIAEIARALEGIPLAIEIAAGYGQLLSLDDLGEIVSRPLDLAALNSPDSAQARHATLRNAVDWSYRLLTPADQWALRRLSVLTGTFTIDDACDLLVEVSHPSFQESLNDSSMGMVMHLAQQGLLSRAESPTASVILMFRLVSEYARNQLELCGEAQEANSALITTALRFSERAAVELKGGGEDSWRELVDRRSATLASALRRCREEGDIETGTEILWNIGHSFLRGPQGWASQWVDDALLEPDKPVVCEGKLLILASLFRMTTGARAAASEMAQRGFSILCADTYPRERSEAFGMLRFFVRPPELLELAAESDALVDSMAADENVFEYSRALRARGMRRLMAGDVDGAEADFTAGMKPLPRELSTLKRSLLHGLAIVQLRRGDLTGSKALLQQGLDGPIAGPPVLAVSQMFNLMGIVTGMLGETLESAKAYSNALRSALITSTTTPLRQAYRGVAMLAESQGRVDEAARLLGAASNPALSEALHELVRMASEEQLRERLMAQMGDGRFESAFRQGSQLSIDRATAEALEELEHTMRELEPVPESVPIVSPWNHDGSLAGTLSGTVPEQSA